MEFRIQHEIKGRMRVHILQGRMSCRQADILQYQLGERQEILRSGKKRRM